MKHRSGDHPSCPSIAIGIMRPTRKHGGRRCPDKSRLFPYLALLQVGFASTPRCHEAWCALTAPFHPCLCSLPREGAIGGLLSVALSVASRRLGVTQHPARWSPDFPLQCAKAHQSGHPAILTSIPLYTLGRIVLAAGRGLPSHHHANLAVSDFNASHQPMEHLTALRWV